MMEKRNTIEPNRTPCAFCGAPSTHIRSDGVPVCSLHNDTPIQKQSAQNFIDKQNLKD